MGQPCERALGRAPFRKERAGKDRRKLSAAWALVSNDGPLLREWL